MAKRVSIHDIALRANVSHSTVSRALRGHPRISAGMRARIAHIAQELDYTPNAIARSLQQQQSHTIGVVVSDVADPFWGEVIKGVEEVVGAHHKALLLSSAQHHASGQMHAIEVFAQRRVDGIVVADSQLGDTQLDRLQDIGIPTVFVNSQTAQTSHAFRHVCIDNYQGGVLAARHLYDYGHRQVAYLGSTKRPASHQLRQCGFVETYATYGVAVDVMTATNTNHDDLELGYQLAQQIPTHISGVFCYNDQVALGALSALRARGRSIPEDISIIGFDDISIAKHSWPPLSSIAQPKALLGRTAMQTLIEVLTGLPGRDDMLEPHVVVRQSSAAIDSTKYTKEFVQ